MHRLVIAATAASVLALAGAAHAGWNGGYSGGYSSAPSCGCQDSGYEGSGGWSYNYESPYVDLDDGYESYGYEGYDYVPFETSSYGRDQDWSYEDYSRRDYAYDDGGSYYARPRYHGYEHDYDRDGRRPRRYSYRSYHYTPRYSTPHYSRPRYSAPSYHHRYYGHSSTDGERG